MIARTRLQEVLQAFSGIDIAVLGDIMLDEFVWGKVDRISPEAPVPVVQIKKETVRPGGAANVASNIVALGAGAHIYGIVGNDESGRKLTQALAIEKIGTDGLIVDSSRCTTVKTRVIGQNQQMLRIDRESTEIADHGCVRKLTDALLNRMSHLSGVIVSDYAKGVVVGELLSFVIDRFKKAGKFVNIDPKLKNFSLYEGATIITPNTREAESALGRVFETDADVLIGGQDLLKKFRTDAILITRSEAGMSLFERGKPPMTSPTQALDVYDVTGAGDTVIASLSLAMAAGCSLPEAAEIANLAAGVVVGIVGTAVATPAMVLDHYDRVHYKNHV
ncbi:MAG: D-glycero-beta-D-manno-heptose-7-phosphate kinase [Candidatus Riflebacteria bacterium]|nr:D-glycero-beta-D-manno-heptose-7-phosphate kinase [Candidatus Riflebacteria bacterium]